MATLTSTARIGSGRHASRSWRSAQSAEEAGADQANEYEREGLDDDDDSDGEKEGKEDYVSGGGGEQQVDYVIAIAT
jgi:hypothetical protein